MKRAGEPQKTSGFAFVRCTPRRASCDSIVSLKDWAKGNCSLCRLNIPVVGVWVRSSSLSRSSYTSCMRITWTINASFSRLNVYRMF